MADQGKIPTTEPSVWDLFIDKLSFWKHNQKQVSEPHAFQEPAKEKRYPWFSFGTLTIALAAQLTLEPSPNRTPWPGIILYSIAAVFLVIAIIRREWRLAPHRPNAENPLKTHIKLEFLIGSILLAIFAFILFGNGLFGVLNTFFWILALVLLFIAFLSEKFVFSFSIRKLWKRVWGEGFRIKLSERGLVILGVTAVILFFNFYRLETVPPEMVSDQAEKLLDINDVLHGQMPVYFLRNTGREAMHFYLTAAYMAIFNLDVSFLNLKAVAVFANLLTLLFIFLLGKEFGNKWVGLGAALFAGMAYWPLIFTRLALRIPYYPLFVAPVLYFMVRGLRRQRVSDILLTGLFLGLGLHGYTPFRIVPIFVLIGIFIYVLHRPGNDRWLEATFALFLIVYVSLVVFIPLLRFWISNPDLFGYRALSRLTQMETSFTQSPLIIFLQNFWKASVMFFWDNGVIWVHSIPGRPALEVVSGALYFLGILGLLIRYIRERNWMDLFLLVSIPMLLMPSILSLAFPGENPSLNRTAGAVVPVFVVIGLALEAFIRGFRRNIAGNFGKLLSLLILAALLIFSGVNNYDLVFNQYYHNYRAASWNTSEIGRIAGFFIESLGTPQTTYVVGYPHWVDSRLVAINAGYPGMDFAIFHDQIPETVNQPGPKLFFLNLSDIDNLQLLQETYNDGVLSNYDSDVENKDFVIFFVPAAQGELN